MATGICKFCGNERKLIKAHLLSKTLMNRIKDKNHRFELVELATMKSLGQKQDDLFDKNILCGPCDNLFSPAENYFRKFIEEISSRPDHIQQLEENRVFIYENVDTIKLRLFPLITLWRMSISKLQACSQVELGPLESIVYNQIKKGEPGPANFFPFVIYSLKELDDVRRRVIGNPISQKMSGGRYYILPISDFIIVIRAGRAVSETEVMASAYDSIIEVVSLRGTTGRRFLDTIFPTLPSAPLPAQ
jgi:hypothetical protein